jgi:D-alanyl-D-alanine carboxypeptidase
MGTPETYGAQGLNIKNSSMMVRMIAWVLFLATVSVAAQESFENKDLKIDSIMQSYLVHKGKKPVHNFLLHSKNENSGYEVFKGVGIVGRNDTPIEADYQFKTASITKTFVSVITLQLVEEGKLAFDDRVQDYLKDLDFLDYDHFMYHNDTAYAPEITLEQLLRHTSGVADIFTDKETRFVLRVLTHKKKEYDEQDVVDLYYKYKLHKMGLFRPGQGYHYSDMNYMLLGFVIEQVTGKSLPENIRQRILEPLKMENTYFEYYEPARGKLKQIDTYLNRLNVTKKVNTSYEWAGGGLVSNTRELSTFIEAVFKNRFFGKEMLAKMIDMGPSQEFGKDSGMGIFLYKIKGREFYGHGGFYGSIMLYSPEQKISFTVNIGQAEARLDPYQLVDALLAVIERE